MVSEAASKRDSAKIRSERMLRKFNRFFNRKFVLKEGSENSTDSLIEFCLNLRLPKKNILLPSFFLYSGCSSKVKANILPKFVFVPLLQ